MFDLQKIDLSLLISGLSFTFACTLHKNRIAIQIQAFSNTRAYRYVFLDSSFASDLCCVFRLKPQRLLNTVCLKRYDSKKRSLISYYLSFNLEIDGQQIYYLLILIVELGSYNMIIRQNFFDYFYIMINVHY